MPTPQARTHFSCVWAPQARQHQLRLLCVCRRCLVRFGANFPTPGVSMLPGAAWLAHYRFNSRRPCATATRQQVVGAQWLREIALACTPGLPVPGNSRVVRRPSRARGTCDHEQTDVTGPPDDLTDLQFSWHRSHVHAHQRTACVRAAAAWTRRCVVWMPRRRCSVR